MGDYNSIRTHHDFMSFNIYNFLDNLLAAVRPSETLESESLNCDQVNTDVKPGGYSEDIFIFLSAREKEEYCCSVCYSVVKDAHQCRNDHKFCYSCIYVWSTCNRAGADCCPACRCEGVYARNDQINEKIGRKRVKCISEGCNWRGFLREYNDHEHRIYDFRELNTTIELPFIKEKESPISLSSTSTINKIESSEIMKSDEIIDSENDLNKNMNSNISTDNINEIINLPGDHIPERVSRPSLVPRRLVREAENSSHNARPPILRPNMNNYSRFTILSTRCNNYRNSNNSTRLSRLSRNTINGNLNNHDTNSITTENTSRQTGNNEFSQAHILDSADTSHQQITSNNRENSRENTDLSNRGANGGVSRRNLQLPAINQNNPNHVTSERVPLEYRRLAPTYASRRNNFVISPSEGREQLAMMLILLTSDLEDRVSLSEQARDQSSSQSQIGNETNISSSSNLTNRASGLRLGRSRLQEFRNLNRRLSEVANSLDRLIASTSREGELNNPDFNGSPGSTNSNESDVDEEFNNNSFYR